MPPSTGAAADARAAGLDVYLLPAVVGGGLGDIDEVLAAGRRLGGAGFPVHLFRLPGHAMPRGVDGPWDWPEHVRLDRLRPRATRALTIAPAWGITAAPEDPGPLGRAGPWADEATAIERAYGPRDTMHVSLEEFARTLTAKDEQAERLREGGVPARDARRRGADRASASGLSSYRRDFRRFRAFDRSNVLHLFAGFRYDPAFAREHPEAVQVGPLWSGLRRGREPTTGVRDRWLWYASPASAETIAPSVLEGLRRASPTAQVAIRSPRPWGRSSSLGAGTVRTEPVPAARWRRQFREASVRIVTGSRTLLDALELGGPFLYFNGVLGAGPRRRRHRPEKIVQLLRLARDGPWPSDLVRDLADFARGRRVAAIVERVASRRGGWTSMPRLPPVRGFAPGFGDAGAALVRCAREFARGAVASDSLVARTRLRARP